MFNNGKRQNIPRYYTYVVSKLSMLLLPLLSCAEYCVIKSTYYNHPSLAPRPHLSTPFTPLACHIIFFDLRLDCRRRDVFLRDGGIVLHRFHVKACNALKCLRTSLLRWRVSYLFSLLSFFSALPLSPSPPSFCLFFFLFAFILLIFSIYPTKGWKVCSYNRQQLWHICTPKGESGKIGGILPVQLSRFGSGGLRSGRSHPQRIQNGNELFQKVIVYKR